MTDQEWRRLNALVHKALALPASERAEFLERACGDDDALRREAQELVEVDARELDSFEQPAVSLRDEDAADAPERVDVYRLVEVIGQGGTGSVYLGVRDDREFEHRVAVKILKRGMDTDEIVARFRTERQILANLEHPNIAELHGGGTTPDHRPYFVLELVEGLPIDRYCDQQALTVRQRIELFLQVCDAVQFAHQNLVVHRDLKPSNILVNSDGEPKLLDFGIAKLLDPATGAAGTVTETGWRMMTPEYASPEQVRGEPVTTASDVYALGILLYELLSGRRPYQIERRSQSSVHRTICHTIPERPSSRVERPPEEPSTETASTLAQRRSTTPPRLRRQLRGDLDTIIQVALHKEPRRRYPSARRLAEDLELYLRGLPISARRDTLGYRMSKLLQRRRREALLILLTLVALGVGVAGRLEQEREAELQRDRAERVTEFLVDLFEVADPETSPGADLTAREILDRGVERLDDELRDEPELRARLLATICRVYRNLGLYEQALPLAETALALRRSGGTSLDLAQSLDDLGTLNFSLGRYADAREQWQEARQLRIRELGTRHEESTTTTNDLAVTLWKLGELEQAESLLRDVLAADRERYGDRHLGITRSLNNLALLLQEEGKFDDATQLLEESLEIKRRALGDEHPRVALALNNLAVLRLDAGDFDGAEELLVEVLRLARAIYGESHPRVAATLGSIARVHRDRGELDRARELLRQSYAMRLEAMPADSPALAAFSLRLARVELELGDREEAERIALQAYDALLRGQHPAVDEALELLEELEADPLALPGAGRAALRAP
ncbi:MAG: serine/threonine-protein kinase [Acidobacteriota bacterium]